MHRSLAALWAGLALSVSAAPALAADLNVPADYPTIQAAIDAAAAGDTILVAPGTYAGPFSFNQKSVNLVATGGPDVTILDGEDAHGILVFTVPSVSTWGGPNTVDGFTLTRGANSAGAAVYNFRNQVLVRNCTVTRNHGSYGGAFWAYYGATTTIEDSRVTDNVADGNGGAAYGDVGGHQVYRSLFARNRAGGSGGAFATGSYCGSAHVFDSQVLDNVAAGSGGAFWSDYSGTCNSRILASGSLVAGNSAGGVGGAMATGGGYAGLVVMESTVVGNSAPSGGALSNAGGSGHLSVRGAILWGNGPGAGGAMPGGPYVQYGTYNDISYSIVEPGTATGFPSDATNLSSDPLFVDAAARDFRLQAGSPAIDAGLPADAPAGTWAPPPTDLAGVARPQGPAWDIGAFEWSDTAPPTTTASVSGAAGLAGWYVGPVTVALAASDAGGVAQLLFSLDGAAETAVPGAAAEVVVTTDGLHALAFHAVDRSGNVEAPGTLELKVDQAAPVPAAPALAGTAGQGGWWRSPVTVTLGAADATSGVATLAWSTGGAPTVVAGASATIPVTAQGTSTVTWSATDAAGLSAAGAPVTVSVDTGAPTVRISTSPTSIKANNKLQPVRVTASATDAVSGVASLAIRVTNRAGALVGTVAPGGTIQLKGTKGERYTFTATAADRAGNAASAAATVRVD